ncbi:MAG TPA: hypothetical protein DCY88_03645 [Cyanobacteria bacterium UBA11372]|nr:hypothetical protein [Cyanobacteria bacterium UBA11372]
MSNPSDKSSSHKSLIPVQTIVLGGITWAVLAFLFFMLFSYTPPGTERPQWYVYGTYIFEQVAYLAASLLCLRNWRSPQIVSGRGVWLGIGLGMLFYFIGNLLFGYWEIFLGLEPDVSLGDLFFIATYIALGWGMILAVKSKRLSLVWWQWGIVGAIAIIGSALAVWINTLPVTAAELMPKHQNIAQIIVQQASPTTKPAPKAPPVQPSPVPKPSPSPKPTPSPEAAATAKAAPPAWIMALDEQLKPLAAPISLFYVVSDICLLILATMLLLAFWGGRFAQSWRVIAAAALSLYIADMWFKWAEKQPNYESGSLPEVFWVFSGVLFAIGAALEYDTSSRSRRPAGRRRG